MTKIKRKTKRNESKSKNKTKKIRIFLRINAATDGKTKAINKKKFFSANFDVTIIAILRKKILIKDNEFFRLTFASY
jgi:hypothetical protein